MDSFRLPKIATPPRYNTLIEYDNNHNCFLLKKCTIINPCEWLRSWWVCWLRQRKSFSFGRITFFHYFDFSSFAHLFNVILLLMFLVKSSLLKLFLKLYHAVHLMKENGIYFGYQTDKLFHPLLTQNIKHGFETMKWCVGFYSDWLDISKLLSIIYHFQQLGWCWMWKSVLCSHRSVQMF